MYLHIFASTHKNSVSEHTSWKEFEEAFDRVINELSEIGGGYLDLKQGSESGSESYATIDGSFGFFVVHLASKKYKFEGIIVNPSLKDPEDYIPLSAGESYKKYATDNLGAAGEMIKSLLKTGKEINIEPNIWTEN